MLSFRRLQLSPFRGRSRKPSERFRPRHCASIPPHLTVISDEAQHIEIDEPGGAQCREIAPKRLPQAEPQIGDQYLGRQIGADLAITPDDFGALARIGDEPARSLGPIVREVVVAPEQSMPKT